MFLGAAFIFAALIRARHVWKITPENLRRRRFAIVQRMRIFISNHNCGAQPVHDCTVEDVETEAQRDLIKALGCDEAEGFLFSRPVPPPEIKQYLETGAMGGP